MIKLLGGAIVVILLIIAVEGGYYWGFNRGLKNAPAAAAIPAQIPAPAAIFSGKDPADIQTTLNALALLFKPQVIDHLKGVPTHAVWGSYWSISVGGKLSFLGDKEILLELTPDQGARSWTLPPLTHYRIYNETTRQSNDTPKEAIQFGDTINFSVSFDTRTGEAKEAWITKSVKN